MTPQYMEQRCSPDNMDIGRIRKLGKYVEKITLQPRTVCCSEYLEQNNKLKKYNKTVYIVFSITPTTPN